MANLSTTRRVLRTSARYDAFKGPRQRSLACNIERRRRIRLLASFAIITLLNFFRRGGVLVRRLLLQGNSAVSANRRLAIFLSAPVDANGKDRLGDLSEDYNRRIETATRINGYALHVDYSITIFRFKGRLTFVDFSAIARRFRDVHLNGILSSGHFFLDRRFDRLFLGN